MVNLTAGAWHLRHFDLMSDQGTWEPWAQLFSGLLIYTNDGYVSVAINRNIDRNPDPINDVLFYAGRYRVIGNQIIHEITNATDVDRIGKTLVRDVSYDGSQLTLTGRSAKDKPFRLVWSR